MNYALGNSGVTLIYSAPVCANSQNQGNSLRKLAIDMAAVNRLILIGGNPAYSAPADSGFAQALGKVALSIRLGLYEDEAWVCHRHVPAKHFLETWSDAGAYDGVTLQN